MSAVKYTSYETSLALREAGAPQGPPERSWATLYHRLVEHDRAARAKEE